MNNIYLNIESEQAGLTEIVIDIGESIIEIDEFWIRVSLTELKIDGEWEGGEEEGEDQRHFETVSRIERAGGDEDHQEHYSTHSNRAGEEYVPREQLYLIIINFLFITTCKRFSLLSSLLTHNIWSIFDLLFLRLFYNILMGWHCDTYQWGDPTRGKYIAHTTHRIRRNERPSWNLKTKYFWLVKEKSPKIHFLKDLELRPIYLVVRELY